MRTPKRSTLLLGQALDNANASRTRVKEMESSIQLRATDAVNDPPAGLPVPVPAPSSTARMPPAPAPKVKARTARTTVSGTPDRRFKENRALTKEDVDKMRGRQVTSRTLNGVHVNKDGIPDRRYRENRALTDEEIEIRKVEVILTKVGVLSKENPTLVLTRQVPK